MLIIAMMEWPTLLAQNVSLKQLLTGKYGCIELEFIYPFFSPTNATTKTKAYVSKISKKKKTTKNTYLHDYNLLAATPNINRSLWNTTRSLRSLGLHASHSHSQSLCSLGLCAHKNLKKKCVLIDSKCSETHRNAKKKNTPSTQNALCA